MSFNRQARAGYKYWPPCGCSGWLRRKLWILRSCSGWASSSSWTRSLCPLVQRLGARNAWFDYGYMLAGLQRAFGRISTIFHVPGWTRDPEVNSRLSCVRCLEEVAALVVDYGSGMRFSWFGWFFAPRAVFPTIAGRSKFLLMSSCTWKSVHYFYEPPCIFSISHSRFFALVEFLGPSSTHSCECSRAGGAGVAGSLTPR